MKTLIILLIAVATIAAQGPTRIWEKNGVSSSEWEIVTDSGMSRDTLHMLLRMGVTVREYYKRMWLKYGIPESEWLLQRRMGRTEQYIATVFSPDSARKSTIPRRPRKKIFTRWFSE